MKLVTAAIIIEKDSVLLTRRKTGQKMAGVLFENYEEISSYTAEKQAIARDSYEKQLGPGT